MLDDDDKSAGNITIRRLHALPGGRCMPPSLRSPCTPKRAAGLRDRAGWRSGCLAGCARNGAGALTADVLGEVVPDAM